MRAWYGLGVVALVLGWFWLLERFGPLWSTDLWVLTLVVVVATALLPGAWASAICALAPYVFDKRRRQGA